MRLLRWVDMDRRADQPGRVDELVGDRTVCLLTLAVEVKRLDLVRNLAEPEPVGEIDVEVRLPAPHPTEVEEKPGADDAARRLEIALDRDLHRGRDLEVRPRPAALREPGLEMLAPGLL